MQQDDFIARALRTAGVKPGQAKALYFKLWALHIDSRALLLKDVTNGSSEAAISLPERNDAHSTASKVHIRPGMFFRLSTECAEDGSGMVMVMGPESSMERHEGRHICADVCLSDGTGGSYELFIARQRVVKEVELQDAVVMEYDVQPGIII
jgi:kinesin family member 2/24